MSYLLDTHTLLWALTAPSRLGAGAARVVADRRSTRVDELEAAAAGAAEASRLWARMDEIPPHDFEPSARR